MVLNLRLCLASGSSRKLVNRTYHMVETCMQPRQLRSRRTAERSLENARLKQQRSLERHINRAEAVKVIQCYVRFKRKLRVKFGPPH